MKKVTLAEAELSTRVRQALETAGIEYLNEVLSEEIRLNLIPGLGRKGRREVVLAVFDYNRGRVPRHLIQALY